MKLSSRYGSILYGSALERYVLSILSLCLLIVIVISAIIYLLILVNKFPVDDSIGLKSALDRTINTCFVFMMIAEMPMVIRMFRASQLDLTYYFEPSLCAQIESNPIICPTREWVSELFHWIVFYESSFYRSPKFLAVLASGHILSTISQIILCIISFRVVSSTDQPGFIPLVILSVIGSVFLYATTIILNFIERCPSSTPILIKSTELPTTEVHLIL